MTDEQIDDKWRGIQAIGRVRLRTLIVIRWIGVAGQLITICVAAYGLELNLPLGSLFGVVGVSALLNLAAMAQRRSKVRLGDRDVAVYLGYDLLQLAVLLALTGGLDNPFAVLLLVPLTVSAMVLERRSTMLLTILTLVCVSLLGIWHAPLPSGPEGPMELPSLHNLGVWIALTLAAGFVAVYVWRVAEEARRFADAYTASQSALARQEQVSAVGALAAAAAHELGTPLATISVVAKELAREVHPDDPLAEDIALVASQAERCRDILTELTRQPETSGGAPYDRLSPAALIEAAALSHRRAGIALSIVTPPTHAGPPPVIKRSPEMVHGLGNLLQNAFQFARRKVVVETDWDAQELRIAIKDDGPGFAIGVLDRLGEPYLSGRGLGGDAEGHHMGLGIFIASTLLERSGARMSFGNNRSGGALVVVRWKRHMFWEDNGTDTDADQDINRREAAGE